ncbi:ABC transporter substrate-binding protein [Streptomyces sp. NPDC049040]|uniref:ABC transporter substrate-binding protein n=1 Tax=Streptomyces sp. NPDC049040 TaxID=3365593 RepID=UPI00371D34B8
MSERTDAAPIPAQVVDGGILGRLTRRRAAEDTAAGTPAPSGTLRELGRRRLALLVLAALTTLSLFGAYRGVHGDAVPLKLSGARGVLAVDTAMDALTMAQQDIAGGDGTTGDFHTRISVAGQSLARAAAADVTGLSGQQTIQTVTGLISTYSGWTEDASAQEPGSDLQDAYLGYAKSMLGVDTTGPEAEATVLGRLRELQAEQQQVVRGQTDFGWLLWLEWSAALVLALALLVLLVEAQRFTGARFRRRWNPPLLGAVVLLVAGTAVLVVFTALTHAGMADSRTVLTSPLAGDEIPRAGATVSSRLANSGFRAAASGWILAGGLLLMVLVVLGLRTWINEYRVGAVTSRWPRTRTLGVIGLCLALLATGGALAVRATGWKGSVTLLANWTGTEQDEFQRLVIDRFEDESRIHVIYQGSSAESQVLAADVESGTPPDVAILPGPGELAGYAAKGMLTPLDGLAGNGEFGSAWVTRVQGHVYWLPIKADLKSMVWHPASTKPAAVDQAAKSPGSWCLGMGSDATSGWPGSDWIEDILLQQTDPDTYDAWVTGWLSWRDDRVRKAWETWGRLVGAGKKPYVKTALTTPFGKAADGVPGHSCELEHQSSFARGSDAWTAVGADYVHSAEVIPGAATGGRERWEVSGDLAAVLHSTPQSRKLIDYLASDEAQRAWAGTQSGFSVKLDVLDGHPSSGTAGRIAGTLGSRDAVRCYDGSDVMQPQVRDAFALAVLRFLADPGTLDDQLKALDRISRHAGTSPLTEVCQRG